VVPAKRKENLMKPKKSLTFLGAIGVVVIAGAAAASAAGPGPGNGSNDSTNTTQHAYSTNYQNHYLDPNGAGAGWYTNMARWSNAPVPQAFTNRHSVVAPSSGPRVDPPGPRPHGPLTPADVEGLVRQFQKDREAFMTRQRTIEQQMSSAGEQERQRLRDQLKEQMEQWKQQQARLREQLAEQCARLGEQLRDHTRLMDRVSNPGTGSGGSGTGGPRGRQ